MTCEVCGGRGSFDRGGLYDGRPVCDECLTEADRIWLWCDDEPRTLATALDGAPWNGGDDA